VIALTRAVSPRINDCIVTHLARVPIDVQRAQLQHEAYERTLRALGCDIVHAPAAPDLPDGVFVEDAAIVFDEIAILTRPALHARQEEVASLADVVGRYRALAAITAPATLEGGDVLRIGSDVFVGLGERTNADGIEQMRALLEPFGYNVSAVPVTRCLHLKTAVCAIADGTVLINPAWVDADAFHAWERIDVDPAEPFASNVLRVRDTLIHAEAHARTRGRLEAAGMRVVAVDMSELAKAEAGVTCCSVLFEAVPA
jgi:dimethylargininase